MQKAANARVRDSALGEVAMIECGLCGAHFTREEAEQCKKGCPISRGCGMVTCPSCGYEFPPESKIMNALTKLFRGRADAEAARGR